MEAIFAHLQTINNEWDAIRGHCPPSSAISDHLPFRNCWELDIRSRRLLEARADTGRHLEGTNDHWGPTWDYWDWFLSLPFTAIRVGARLPGPPTIVRQSTLKMENKSLTTFPSRWTVHCIRPLWTHWMVCLMRPTARTSWPSNDILVTRMLRRGILILLTKSRSIKFVSPWGRSEVQEIAKGILRQTGQRYNLCRSQPSLCL